MGKRYIHVVDDPLITDAATFDTMAAENPAQYPFGGLYVLQNGVLLQIVTNDGTTVGAGTVTVVVA